MLDLEAVERTEKVLEELVPRLEGLVRALSDIESDREFFAKNKIQELLDEIEAADSEEKKDAALKKVSAFLKKLMEYYPYPYPYPYKEKKSVEEENTEENTTEENSDQTTANVVYEELEALRKENSELKAKLEQIAAEELFKARVSKLQEVDNEKDWGELKEVILKMSDEEFEKFSKSLTKQNHSTVPESQNASGTVFKQMKEAIKEVKLTNVCS